MIRSFADRETERFFTTGLSRKLPIEIHRRAAMRLTQGRICFRFEAGSAYEVEIVDYH